MRRADDTSRAWLMSRACVLILPYSCPRRRFWSLMGTMQGPVDAQGPEEGPKMEPAADEGFMRIG